MIAPRRFETILSPLVIVGTASFIGGIAATYVYFALEHQSRSEYAVVEQRTLVQTVEGAGSLKPTESVDLGFKRGGMIGRIAVAVGSRVSGKQLLASLASGNLSGQLEAAKAQVNAETAKLQELQAGTSSASLAVTREAVVTQILESYQVADTAVNKQAGQFIRSTGTPRLLFYTSNSSLEKTLLAESEQIHQVLEEWKNMLPVPGAATSSSALAAQATAAANHLSGIEAYLNHAATLLAHAVPTDSTPAAQLEMFRSVISEARLSIAGSLTQLTAATGKLSVSEVVSGPEAVEAAEAVLQTTIAKVRALEAQIQDTRLYAPISGTITEVRKGAGASVPAGAAVFALSSDASAEMVASLSAADAAKVHVGDAAEVHLREYPDRSFAAQIVAVNPPASTDVAQMYTIVAQLTNSDQALPFGISGTLAVTAASSDNALVIPQSAIIIKDGQPFVLRSRTGSSDELVPVTVGMTVDGNTEIIAGLKAGDRIRTSISVY
jgi:HlyD family secretion protein